MRRCVNRWPSECGIKRRLPRWRVAIAQQLHIQLRVDRLASCVDDLMLHLHGVAVALYFVCFDQLNLVDGLRDKLHLYFVFAIFEFGAPRLPLKVAFVGWQRALGRNQA